MAINVQPASGSESESEPNLLAIAQQSISESRRAVERLMDSISLTDHFALGVLGPILAGLRNADRGICDLD